MVLTGSHLGGTPTAVGTAGQGWLEIHRGDSGVFGDVQQALDRQLAAKGAVVTVRLDQWPLDVSDPSLPHTRVYSSR